MLKNRDDGQLHVLEVLIAALLFLSSVRIAVAVAAPAPSGELSTIRLERMARDSLIALDNLYSDDENMSFLQKTIHNNDAANLTKTLNKLLPKDVSFAVFVGDGKNYRLFCKTAGPIGETGNSHLILSLGEEIIDVRIILWFEPRGAL